MSCFRYLTITIWISIYHKGTPVSFMSINHQIAPITHSLFLFLSVEREIPSAKSHPWVIITKSTSKVIHRVRGCQWRGKKTKLRKTYKQLLPNQETLCGYWPQNLLKGPKKYKSFSKYTPRHNFRRNAIKHSLLQASMIL